MVTAGTRRLTASDIFARKGGEKLICLTAYHHYSAALIDPHCDVLLVGDSLGNVVYGFDTTLPVTLDMMIAHGRAVVKGSHRALVVVDMPFRTYEGSKEQAFESASRVMQETGCGAVKLEGGTHVAETIAFLVARGIPVMAHIGLTPQSIHALGSYRARGKAEALALAAGGNIKGPIESDAVAIAEAGAFSVVIEAVHESLARHISRTIAVPTIGIGASQACDGQILVLEDMLGMTGRSAKFVRHFANMGQAISQAAADYAAAVRDGSFPGHDHLYGANTGNKGEAA